MASLQLKAPTAGVASRRVASRAPLRVAAAKEGTSAKADEIYIGFPKGDYARPPGRKGRVIRDDPKKYPGKEDMGFFLGAVGGWAGGEAGLWQLRDQIKAEGSTGSKSTRPPAPSSPIRQPAKTKWGVKPAAPGKDAAPIYVGFSKDELELRKSGAQGRVIFDQEYKYPGKEDLGFFMGAVGGFAGGEAALKEFAQTGELKLRKPGEPVRKQFSPLTYAFLIFFAAAAAAALSTLLPPSQ